MENKQLVLNMARDLCQKLLERHLISSTQVSSTLNLLTQTGTSLLKEETTIFLLGSAVAITGRLIEKNRLSNSQAVAINLDETFRSLKAATLAVPETKASEALKISLSLILKLLETNALPPKNIPETVMELTKTAASLL